MNTIVIIACIGLGAVIAYIIYQRIKAANNTDPTKVDWSKEDNGAIRLASKVQQHTHQGVRVFSNAGLSPEQLDLIDAGLEEAFQAARESGYTKKLSHTDYTVHTPKFDCVPSPEQRVPSFLIRADNYDGTIYDYYNPVGKGIKDGIGVVYATELMISAGTPGSIPPTAEMVCCPDSEVLQNATRYGAEHILAANNNGAYFIATATHTTIGHPILPERDV